MTLSFHHLQFERHNRNVFSNVSGEIRQGECLQVTGANGSGKTTLLRIVSGLLESNQGEVLWNQQSISQIKTEYQQQLHYISHQNAIKPHWTVAEHIEFYSILNCKPVPIITELLDQIGLKKYRHYLAGHLSAGLLRRLSLIRLLLNPVPLWILDEPFTALDHEAQQLWWQILTAHLNQGGLALITSHHPLSLNHTQLCLNDYV